MVKWFDENIWSMDSLAQQIAELKIRNGIFVLWVRFEDIWLMAFLAQQNAELKIQNNIFILWLTH